MGTEHATLIYDGECGMCRDAVRWLTRWDRGGRLTFVPFQDEVAVQRFGIPLPSLAAAMHLVLPDGRVFAGADAVPELARLVRRGARSIPLLYRVPGVRHAARRVYAWIAARRKCAIRPAALASPR
jgi:predicted DCC family thiol-disulfide oxidoreductase YuxK